MFNARLNADNHALRRRRAAFVGRCFRYAASGMGLGFAIVMAWELWN